ncbi:MAG: FkbM family methyltransferase [Pseudonocardiaceae bacterium]
MRATRRPRALSRRTRRWQDEPATKPRWHREVREETARPTRTSFAYRRDTRQSPIPSQRCATGSKDLEKSVLWLRRLKQTETHRVRVRPLSAVIDESGIKVIDLLKIDVEGAEVDVLSGINERHCPMVQQVVVEVENWEKSYPLVREILESKNF